MKPTKPSYAGLNALYELRDVPYMLRQRFTPDLRGASNYWLALQFGWIALLRDVRNLVNTQRNAQKRLKQLLRDNGKPVRRRINLAESRDDISVSDGSEYNAVYPSFVSYFYAGPQQYRETFYTQERWWAAARFRYWLPGGPRDIAWTRKMMAKIFGLYPTPEVIYNAIPWTWLIDWFGNLGDVISNIDAGVADRLAADYFYVMRSFEMHRVKDSTFHFYSGPSSSSPVISGTVTMHSKSWQHARAPGDPFGFNTNQNSLTGMQLSILGALGMSKVR